MNMAVPAASPSQTQFSIHPKTSLGYVALAVADIERQLAFYQEMLGFRLHWREGNQAGLGAGGADLLLLAEKPGVRKYSRVTGLYHFAILFPDRRGLARAIARLSGLRYRNYPTDHIMTKSTYLDDAEGNGIELYAESPEDGIFTFENGDFLARRADGAPSNGREAMDIKALFSLLPANEPLDGVIPPETRLGHVHLHVRNVDEAVAFYNGVLGFDIMGISPSFRGAFVSAGGYHHHVGLNDWQGAGAPPPPADASGLQYFTINLPDPQSLSTVLERVRAAGTPCEQVQHRWLLRDPSQNGLALALQ